METGEKIKQRREELGMSQDELARKSGYKWRSSINKIEVGRQRLPYNKLVDIARALRVTPSYLIGYEDKEESILTALQEEIMLKVYELTPENQETVLGIIDTILQSQTRKDGQDD